MFNLILLPLLLMICGCSHVEHTFGRVPADPSVEAAVARAEPETRQLVVVVGEGGAQARLTALERDAGGWRERFGPWPAMVGRNGFARPGTKREGDGTSPSGLFPLESVFGYAAGAATRMPYRQATENDLWVDDPNAPDYNTWVRRGETTAASFETMRLPDSRYRHGVVIGYNRNPVVKGRGSAIFMHVWRENGKATAGCVALEEEHLVHLIEWLDPVQKPMILMGNPADLPLPAAVDR